MSAPTPSGPPDPPPTPQWNDPFTWGPGPLPPGRALRTTALLFALATLYCVGLIELTRRSLMLEGLIVLGVPLLVVFGGWPRIKQPRLIQLLWFEGIFNALAWIDQCALATAHPDVAWGAGLLIVGWFAVQIGGFAAFAIQQRNPLGVVSHLAIAGIIALWFFETPDLAGAMDAEGRFLLWGADAGLAVQIAYPIWVLAALIGDQDDIYLRETVIHLASVTAALLSGEFWHARLLTAAHLFALDYAFQFTAMPNRVLPDDFAHLPVATRRRLYAVLRPALTVTVALALIGLLLATALLGADLR